MQLRNNRTNATTNTTKTDQTLVKKSAKINKQTNKQQVQTKKRVTLAKRFKCPFCANEEVVECKMDFRQGIGSLACRLCGASYQMPIHHLHEPVDVFSEWLDDCEAAAQGKPTGQAAAAQAAAAAQNDQPQYDISDDEDDDDDLGQPSGLSKGAASSGSAASGKSNGKKSGGEAAPTSYADLGLDDSDDDSD